MTRNQIFLYAKLFRATHDASTGIFDNTWNNLDEEKRACGDYGVTQQWPQCLPSIFCPVSRQSEDFNRWWGLEWTRGRERALIMGRKFWVPDDRNAVSNQVQAKLLPKYILKN